MNPQYSDEINKELIHNIEIQKQNQRALPRVFKDKRYTNKITEQMVTEFKKQFNKSTGDKAYLFPEIKPVLIDQEDELNKIQKPLDNDQLIEANKDLDGFTKLYKLLNDTMIPQHRRIIDEKKDKINRLSAKLDNDIKPETKKVRYDNKLLKQISTLENNIQTLEDNIARDTRSSIDIMSDINQIKQIIEQNNEISDNYSMVRSSVNSKNKKILADYENNIRILNEGKINITQQPDETEQEYLQRLGTLADEEYDDTEMIEKATLFNINEFKKNMKSVINSDWKIENILKSLHREEVFLLNNTFTGFKNLVARIFGLNNQMITPEQFTEFIRSYFDKLEPIQKADEVYMKAKPVDSNPLDDSFYEDIFNTSSSTIDAPYADATLYEEPEYMRMGDSSSVILKKLIEDDYCLELTNKLTGKRLYLRKNDKDEYGIRRVFYKFDQSGVFKPFGKGKKSGDSFIKVFIQIFKNYFELDDEQIEKEFNQRNVKNFNETTFGNILSNVYGLKFERQITPVKFEGRGLVRNLPKFFLFGKINILLDKLYYKNILAVKDKKKANIQGMPNHTVSDQFVDLIMRIIEDKETSKQDILDLDETEQELYSLLMYRSGFYKENKTTDNKQAIERLKKRFELVNGEIMAGNNNDDNFKEIYKLLFKLSNLGALNLSMARKYYKDISKMYRGS